MPWVRLDDQFPDHPKVVQAGPMAAWLYVCGLAYCARHLTDGFIPSAQVPRLVNGASRLVDRLITVGLWEAIDGGYRVHDFLIYNPSREQTLAKREIRASAGARGGKQKASNLLAASQAGATNMRVANGYPVPVPHVAATHTEHLPEEETQVALLTTPPAAAERASAPTRALEPRYSPDFEAWWLAYPRKREKVDAYAAYQKTVKAGADPADLLSAARHYAAAADEQGAEDRFIKLPATFLGPARPWLDFRTGVPAAVHRASPAANGKHESTRAQLDRVFGGMA